MLPTVYIISGSPSPAVMIGARLVPRICALKILRSSATLTLALLSACAAPNAGSSPVTAQSPPPQPKDTRAPLDDASARSDPSSIPARPSPPALRSPDSDESARQNSAPPTAARSPQSSAASSQVDPPIPHADAQPPLPNKTRNPSVPWVASHDPFNPSEEISLTGKWTGNRRLEVHTDNVQRLTLNLHMLPSGAPRSGPWNLQIDRQGIEISGRRGKVIDLIRSPNGVWSVDTEKSPVRR
ncbi:hypothetical protein B7486_13500 [cyanobacterium TDX16]|nr:hypothetical protein B7486_13500 [cyanobacterium TDX16]